MKPLARILAETSPASWPPANGGRHRTSQIYEILAGADIAIAAIPQEQPCLNLRKYYLGLKFLLLDGLAHGASPRRIRGYGGALARVGGALREHRDAKIYLWEMTHPNNLAGAHLARRAGYGIIALPQNLDSLAPGKTLLSPATLAGQVSAEVQALARTHAVFCISREEQWLLSLYGVAADHLPYYPPRELEEFLLTLRARRAAVKPERFLILGSFGNAPTATGMMEQIRLLKSLPDGQCFADGHCRSWHRSVMPPFGSGTQYKLHGTVDQATLAALLIQSKALLIHQSAAVGALTRIPEALIAGLPVIANLIAARSAMEMPGVHVYASASQLREAMLQPLVSPPAPRKPLAAEQRLIQAVRELLDGAHSKK